MEGEAAAAEATPIIPGLPDDLALLCLAHLSHSHLASARSTSRIWRATLSPSILNPIRKSLNLPSQQLLFLSLSPSDSSADELHWCIVDPLYHRCLSLPKPAADTLTSLLSRRAISTTGHIFLHFIRSLDEPYLSLIQFSVEQFVINSGAAAAHHMAGSSQAPDVDAAATSTCQGNTDSCLLKGEELAYDIIQVPNEDFNPLWSAWVGLGSRLVVAGGTIGNQATSMTMTFDGCQWNKLAQLNEPRFMAAGFVFKGEVWVLGGKRLGGAGLEIVSSGEVFMPKLQKWHLVPEMWPKHLQSLEEKVPCVVCFKGRMFGLKMGSNMVVVWDEGRKGWDCLGLIGRTYVEKGFKGKILGVEEDSLWALTEEPFMIFELETSVEMALKWARPSEETVQTREIRGQLSWKRIDSELGLDGFQRLIDSTLIHL